MLDSWKSLGQQGDTIVNPKRKSTLNIHWKDCCWSWSFDTLATWYEELTHWKRPDAGKDWKQEEKGMTEDEMVGWHHWLNGHEFEQTLGDREGLGSLACSSPWGCEKLDTTEQLSNKKVVLVVKNPPADAGDTRDMGLLFGSVRSPREGSGNLLQYSCL